jgi:aryl carrier-like protein
MNVVPKTAGASGIIGIISDSSATHYMGNPEASKHMFRPWGGDNMLLYTDDIGKVTADGRIVINGRRSRNVKVNGLFIDMDELERAMNKAFGGSVAAYKLVQSGQKIVLFWSGESTEIKVFKAAREALKKKMGDNIAMAVSSTRYIEEMPYNASYKIDIAQLQKIADSDVPAPVEVIEAVAPAPAPVETTASRADEVAAEIAQEVARLSKATSVPTNVPLMLAGLNSITVIQLYFWLQEKFDYEEDMSRLFEEDVTAAIVAREIVGDEPVAAVQEIEVPTSSSVNRRIETAMDIAHEIARLAKATSPVPIDVPVMLAGLNSITVVQLHFWLQSSFDYDEDMSMLFEEDCTAESLAAIIVEDATVAPSEADSDATKVEEASDVDAEVAVTAEAIAKEVGRLSKAIKPVPTDIPLMLAGLNSITVIQLHFWLQSEYDYEEDMSRLFEEDVTAEVVACDIRGVPVKTEAAPTSVPTPIVVTPVEPEPVKETPAPVKARSMRRPAPLDLQTSSSTTTSPIPAAMKTGGLKTAGLPTGMVNGFLALTMLSPKGSNSGNFQGNGTPSLSITRASLDMLANTHTPFAPVSAWTSEPHTPKVLCV